MPDQSLGTISALVRLNLANLSADVIAAKGLMGELGASVQSSMGGLATSAGTAMTAVGVAVAAGLGAASVQAAKYDQALRNVDAVSKLTTAQFAALHDGILAIANNPNVRQMPTDLAEGMYRIASAGYDGQEGLDVLKQAALGASAGMSDTKTSSLALLAVMNGMGRGVYSAKDAMDILVREVDTGMNTFGELASQIGDVIPTAHIAGVSFETVAAAIATMTRRGISAAESVTALNQLILHIVAPSPKAAKAMQELGIESGAAAIAGGRLNEWLQIMMEKTGGNLQVIKRILPEVRGLKGALSLAADGGKPFAAAMDMISQHAIGAGATMNALNRQNQGAVAQWEVLKKQLEVLGIQIGEILLPFLRQFVGWLGQLVKWFSNLPAPVKQVLVVFAAVTAAVLLIGGPLLILAGAFAAVSAAVTAAGLTFGAIAAAIAPVIGIVTALIAAVSLLTTAWTQNWGNIQGKTFAVWRAITSGIQFAWNALVDFLRLGFALITGNWKAEGGRILGVNTAIWDRIAFGVKFAIQTITGTIRAFGAGMVRMGSDLIYGLANGIKNGAAAITDITKAAVGSAVTAAKTALGIHSPSTVFQAIGEAIIEGYLLGIEKRAPEVQAAIRDTFSARPAEGAGGPSVTQAAPAAIGAADEATNRQLTRFQRVLKTMAETMTNVFEGAFTDLFEHGWKKFFSDVLKGFAQMLEQMVAELLAKSAIFGILSLFGGGLPGMKSFGSFLGFDDWGNDRKARRWGVDFAGEFTRGMGDYRGRAVADTRSGSTTVHAPITLHATINHEMDIADVARRLAWHVQTRMPVRQGAG